MQEILTYVIIAAAVIVSGNFIYIAISKDGSEGGSDCGSGCNSCSSNSSCSLDQAEEFKSEQKVSLKMDYHK